MSEAKSRVKEMSPDRQAALSLVNQMKLSMAQLARRIADALQDGKVTPMEGFVLAGQGMQFATTIMSVMQGWDKNVLRDVLYVLEHGIITMEE